MSERVLKVLLSELSTVRIVCKKCGFVYEMTLQQLGAQNGLTCVACPAVLIDNTDVKGSTISLNGLASTITALQTHTACRVEFVILETAKPTT